MYRVYVVNITNINYLKAYLFCQVWKYSADMLLNPQLHWKSNSVLAAM